MLEGEWAMGRTSERDEAEEAIRGVLDEVHRYAQFRLGQVEDAEDAVMETWHALRKRPAPFLAADDPRRYAIGVCRRKVADVVRRRRWQFWRAEPTAPPPEDADRRVMVGRVLAGLADDQREVLALKYFHEFSSAEIATITGRSVAAVNSLLQRARKAFAEAAGAWDEEATR
ncbi:sigma-70 family RNA polymerase sigma factor [bacterium]|nr:MAG: sigma-70 family RNA polymerase sigma factor [bacterium]